MTEYVSRKRSRTSADGGEEMVTTYPVVQPKVLALYGEPNTLEKVLRLTTIGQIWKCQYCASRNTANYRSGMDSPQNPEYPPVEDEVILTTDKWNVEEQDTRVAIRAERAPCISSFE